MGYYKWLVIEGYPDGGTWSHFFTTKDAALDAIEQMREAHGGRTYELHEN